MKIVFLDIDGVLNSNAFWDKCCANGNIDEEIDDEAVLRLKIIVEKTNALIVLSSSWRELNSNNELRHYLNTKLAQHGLTIYDQTPKIDFNRPLEIKTWIMNHPELNIDGFVSLDDDYDEKDYLSVGLGGKTIHTSFYDPDCGGLQDIHIEEAISIINTYYASIDE